MLCAILKCYFCVMIFRARSFLLPRFLPCFTWLRPAWTCRSSRRPAKAECTRRYLEARKSTRRDRPTESGTARNLSVPTSGVDTTTQRLFPPPIRLRLPRCNIPLSRLHRIATLRLPEGLRLPRALVRGATPSLLGLLSSLRCTLSEAFVRLGFLSSLVPLQTGGRRRICNVFAMAIKEERKKRKDRSARELGKERKSKRDKTDKQFKSSVSF